MAYSQTKVKDIVRSSVDHDWSIPEFQRGFVWKPSQVRDLIESLWLRYPVGTLLIWDSRGPAEMRGAIDAKGPTQWVVDGQQRTTALCVLSGRKPYWWSSSQDWDQLIRKYDIRFDIHTRTPPYFVVANAATRQVTTNRYIPVRNVLNLDLDKEEDQKKLEALAKQIKLDGLCDGMDAMEVYSRLNRLRSIRDQDVVLITVDNDLEDVVEIFARLNSRGTRVTEADIYLGVVAARAPGWVRDQYLPYVQSLGDVGYDVSPNLVFRTLTGIGRGKIRYKEIEQSFWDGANIGPTWERTKKGWGLAIRHLRDFGIAGNRLLPSDNALVPLTALLDRYPDASFEQTFYWFLQASRFGRYSTSSTSSMEEDLKEIGESTSLSDALERLLAKIRYIPPLSSDDFMRDYGDSRFGRLMLYLMVYEAQAEDWDERSMRIGFDADELLAGFTPQFHHIFPKGYVGDKQPATTVNALGNIALIGPAINIRISKRDPLDYVERYRISDEKLQQQYIDPSFIDTSLADLEKWVRNRAQALADAGNAHLTKLRGNLRLPQLLPTDQASENAFENE